MRSPGVSLLAAGCLLMSACSGGTSAGHPVANAIVIGLINTENAPLGSFPDVRRGVKAAAAYVNSLGGVNGRPLSIVPCVANGTPESSQACANSLLAHHPVAVIGGVDPGAAASLPVLQAAHIPYVGGTPTATDALTSSGSYMFTGGTATEVLGDVAYAANVLHVKRMAAVYADVPGLLSTAAGLLKTIVRRLGVSNFTLFPVEQNAPDVAPALASAEATHPQAIIAVFPAQSCVRLVQAVGALGLKARMMYPSLCAVKPVLAAGGTSLEGSVFATGYSPYTDSSDSDVATYLSAIKKYDASLVPSLLSQAGFSVVMTLRGLLADIPARPTAATLSAELRATRDQAGFMSHAYSCDGRQISLLRSLCNAYVQISVVTHGRLEPDGGWVDTAPIAKLATFGF